MTNNNRKISFAIRVIIAAFITAAIIFLPAAVLAESEDTADGGSSASEKLETGGIEASGADFDAAPGTTSNLGGEPAANLFFPESSANNTAPLPGAPAPETDSNPVSSTLDQQTDLQEPTPSETTDTGDENGENVGLAIEATTATPPAL